MASIPVHKNRRKRKVEEFTLLVGHGEGGVTFVEEPHGIEEAVDNEGACEVLLITDLAAFCRPWALLNLLREIHERSPGGEDTKSTIERPVFAFPQDRDAHGARYLRIDHFGKVDFCVAQEGHAVDGPAVGTGGPVRLIDPVVIAVEDHQVEHSNGARANATSTPRGSRSTRPCSRHSVDSFSSVANHDA